MATSTANSDLLRGMRDGSPFLLVIIPFALLFGVVGTEAGLNIAQVMGLSLLVIAGASQFTAVQLMTENAPTVIVLATALAVNLRMAMYSASLAPYIGAASLRMRLMAAYGLVDQSYAVAIAEFERNPDMTPERRIIYFIGAFVIVAPFWYGATLVGALAGAAIPAEFALDFAVPITFLALTAPALRTLPHVIAAITSVVLALALVDLPYSLGLIIASVCAMTAGALSETVLERRN